MRDPELVVKAQLAASALEGAWHRWRVVHGDVVDAMPAVSSYVGYSLQEPWGQPRVVFGLAAEDAEQLAALLERHDSIEPAYAATAAQPGVRDLPARTPARDVPVPVPRRAPAAVSRQAPLAAASEPVGQPPADMLLAGDNSAYDEPLYRQVAAAMKDAAGAREIASRTKTADAEPARTWPSPADSDSAPEDRAGPVIPLDRPNLADLVSPAWMGSLAMAASTARAEAEARIRAARTKPDEEPADPPAFEAGAGEGTVAADGRAGADEAGADEAGADEAGADEGGADEAGADEGGADEGGADGRGTGRVDADVVGVDHGQEADAGLGEGVDADDGRAAGDGDSPALPQIYATDVLEPLPTPDAEAAAYIPDVEESADEPGQDDQADQNPDAHDPDAADPDAHDLDAADPDGQDQVILDRVAYGRDVYDQDVDGDVPDQDDHDVATGVQSGGPGSGVARRGRVNRGYPIARLSRTKRPDASSQPAGG